MTPTFFKRALTHLALAALAWGAASGPALAQADNYPSKPITVVVGYPPGGSTDLTGRDTTLDTMVGDITNINMAEALTKLEQAQLSVQAAAQVFQTLRGSSLLAILSN